MSQTMPLPPPGFDSLSVEEQIDYVQFLWDHIATQPENIPVPDWHRQILAERLADYEANPDEGMSLEEFEDDLLTDPADASREE